MLEPNPNQLNTDMQILLRDAHVLLHTAATLTGEKVDEVRQRATQLLESGVLKARHMQACAVDAGKEVAACTDAYVHKHPWRAMAIMAGVGLVAGLLVQCLCASDAPE